MVTPKFRAYEKSGTQGGMFANGEGGTPDQWVSESEAVLRVWTKDFQQLLNQESVINSQLELTLRPQMPVQLHRDERFSKSELELALKQMKLRKTTGISGLPVENFLWSMNEESKTIILAVYNAIWDTGTVPQAFRDSIVTVLHKSGDKRVCSNYRGLCLNEHQGKVLERLILNRLIPLVNETKDCVPDSQCGFVPGKSLMNAPGISIRVPKSWSKFI